MGPNTAAEQSTPEKSQAQLAQEAFDQVMANIKVSYQAKFAEINDILDEGERAKARAKLAQEAKNKHDEVRKEITKESDPGTHETPEQKKEKNDNAKKTILEIKYLNDNEVKIGNRQSQLLIDKIIEQVKSGEITDENLLAIDRNLGKQLEDGLFFSKDQVSDAANGLKNLFQVDRQTAEKLYGTIAVNPETYRISRDDLAKQVGILNPEQSQRDQNEQALNKMNTDAFTGDLNQYYRSRFTQEQIELISTFYSPEAFVGFMERMNNGDDQGSENFLKTAEVQHKRQEIEHHIKEYYEKNNKTLTEADLKEQIDKHWGEEVSEKMAWKVSEVINQLFLELQQKSPHKFYEEIMQEDIFQGPAMIQKRIQSAVNSLMTKIGQIENHKDDPLYERFKKLELNLYRHAADKGYIDERNGKTYPRLKPLPYGEQIPTSDFIQYLNSTIDHTIHKAEYFHNSRAIYGHPAGEKGFYNQLGGFAEALRGTDIDEIMMLPDGQYIMQAYQLYEKYLEEDFASLDWRHRPDQFQNQFERVNSKLEIEIFDQLKKFYQELSKERVRNIVNSAVGISRGMFLTEPEKSAYADPVDAEGNGMIASYSTNDAASLNVFNPLHTALRWQGEHNWNMMYFMPVAGEPGSWDHKKAWTNMAKYMDSFIAGHGRNKEETPELFADVMMDINHVGGPNKRKGWRMQYTLDGHYVFDKDGTVNAPGTFRAMEAIGYEAIANFINTGMLGQDLLRATENTAVGQVNERMEMFRYIYSRYFCDDPSQFKESDFVNYLKLLRKNGEAKLIDKISKHDITTPTKGSFINGKFIGSADATYDEMVQYETSQLFMENTLAHYTAARMPTKFLRIDRNRFTENGISRWERIYRELHEKNNWDRAKFDMVMKDLTMTEVLLRREMSDQIRKQMSFEKGWTLDKIENIKELPHRLNDKYIRLLLENGNDKKANFKSPEEIEDVIALWKHIDNDFDNNMFLDGQASETIKKYPFTFGLEDTDISLIPYRGTGPRMIARAIKDIGSIEATITPWINKMPDVLSEVAVNGKHDFTPIVEYLRAAKKAINDVHGSEAAQEFVYKVSGTVINYFKKDGMAKSLSGLFRLGQRNSMAAEYAGRSSAVWEWDSRDIDRYAVTLESYRLLPKNPYDANKTSGGKFIGGQLEDRWIINPFTKKPMKFGKQRHVDFEFNGAKLRREHGADWKAMSWDMLNQFLPLVMAFILWKYIKDAMDEASGKKKQ